MSEVEQRASVTDMVAAIRRAAELRCEAAALHWSTDGQRIRVLHIEIDAIEDSQGLRTVRDADAAQVHPLYWSFDDGEVVEFYALDGISAPAFALGVLDGIAHAVTQDAPLTLGSFSLNWRALLSYFGPEVIPPAMVVLEDALRSHRADHVRYELQGWPVDDEGDPIVGDGEPPLLTAPIHTSDGRFEELGFASCAADAEHATTIVRCDFNDALAAPLVELINRRCEAAKKVLLGELVAA